MLILLKDVLRLEALGMKECSKKMKLISFRSREIWRLSAEPKHKHQLKL